MRDLIVLAADLDLVETMKALVARPGDLGIREIGCHVDKHRFKDPGCRNDPSTPLRPYIAEFAHALVVFDKEGSGSDASREEIQHNAERTWHATGG